MIKFLKIDGQKIDPLDYTLNIIKNILMLKYMSGLTLTQLTIIQDILQLLPIDLINQEFIIYIQKVIFQKVPDK